MKLPVDQYVFPADWSVVSANTVADFARGVSWRKSEEASEREGRLVVSIPNIRDGWIDYQSKYNHYLSKEVPKAKCLQVGDVIFVGSSGSIHNVGRNARVTSLPSEKIAFASFTFKGAPKNGAIESEFFYFLVNSDLVPFPTFCKRAADGKFNFQLREFANNLRIPLPPLPEQKKIAHILSTVQQAIEAQERIIQTTTELKRALMQKLFTEGLRNEPQKQTEIGLVPESWEVVRIGDCCDVSTGTTPSTKNPEYYVGKNPFIKTGEITNNRISSASVYISDEAIAKYNLKVYEPGTLLIAMYGQGKTRGQISILEVPASTSQNAGAIAPSSEVDSEYLWCYLMSQYEQLRRSGIEGHISHLNLGYVKQILFPKPSLGDQQRIASTFRGLDRKMLLHQRKQRVLQDLFRTLLHELMTAKIRVNDIFPSIM